MVGLSLFFPVERALLERINISDEQDGHERKHRAENHRGVLFEHLFVNDRPRVKEHDFDIEKDKEHRDEIELHREARIAFADGQHAAFVGGVFDLGATSKFAENDGSDERPTREQKCDDSEDPHRNVLLQLRRFHRLRI
jgi:hypothetical protein